MPYFLCLWTVVCLERSRTLKINCIYKVKKLSARDIALIGMCDDLQYLSVYVKYSLKIGFWLLMKERTSTTSPKIETGCKTDIYWYFCQKRIKMSQKWLSFPSKAKFNHAANKQTPSSLLGYFQTKFFNFQSRWKFYWKIGNTDSLHSGDTFEIFTHQICIFLVRFPKVHWYVLLHAPLSYNPLTL